MRAPVSVGPPIPGVQTYIGGLRLKFVFLNFGWPAARLTLCEEGLHIGPSMFVFRPFVPVRAFRYDDLLEVQAIGNFVLTRGIRFTSRSTGRWAIFWTLSRAEILSHVSELTQHVNEVPVRLNYWNPGPPSAA